MPKIGRKEMSETGPTKLALKFKLPKLWGKEFCAKLVSKNIFFKNIYLEFKLLIALNQ